MIERLNNTQGVKLSQTTGGQRELIREMRNKTNELIDVVNRLGIKATDLTEDISYLEDAVYGGPDDCDCECNLDNDLCPECEAFFEADSATDSPTPDLSHYSNNQLQAIRFEANAILEKRSQESMMDGLDDDDDELPGCAYCGDGEYVREPYCPACLKECAEQEQPQFATVDTADGLFSDFAGFVAKHPELRLYQALQAWSGYSKLYGEGVDGELDDLFYKRTKEPRE